MAKPSNNASTQKTADKRSASSKARLFAAKGSQPSLTAVQVDLLKAIDETGSITKAAKHLGVSYKTAWDRIDSINNLAEKAVVIRSSGGARGGGTMLTDYGKEMLAGFLALSKHQDNFMRRLEKDFDSYDEVINFLRGPMINSSARNQYRGAIQRITRGAVNAEVVVKISDNQSIVATVTRDSLKQMQLKKGANVLALIKASWVILSAETSLVSSARNTLKGQIARIVSGAVNSDVVVDLGAGKTLSSTVTNQMVKAMKLKKGMDIYGLFKASSVILVAD